MEGIKLFAYADDLIMIAESIEKMKEAISEVITFSNTNFLKINPAKSELLLICGNLKKTEIAGISFK